MAAKAAPSTMTRLASMEIGTRSDYAAWCQGVDNVCDSLSLLIMGAEDELYVRLAAAGGGDYMARRKARMALRPLRALATAIRIAGRQAPRCFRTYQRIFAAEISPQQSRVKATFNHRS